MHWPGRTIWDTRIQDVCGILSARGENGVELFGSASFAQVSLSPARVVVNPNRMYPIEPVIKRTGRFAINVLPRSARQQMIRMMKTRRRQPRKEEVVGLTISEDEHGIPFLAQSLRTVFCEVEQQIESGDRSLYIARVLESRVHPTFAHERPLLFAEVTGKDSSLARVLRTVLVITGGLDVIKKFRDKLRPPPPANIALTTYQEAGATEEELATILKYGNFDSCRHLVPPPAPAIVRNRVGICVVGTGWGAIHCRYLRMANPNVRLFVCGRNRDKTARLARATGAEGFFLEMEQALEDVRVQGLTLALPHDLHRQAVEAVADAGKHALVEKPIATDLADADAMIAAAKQHRTILMVAEDMHFRPAVREAAQRIAMGDIGEPLYLLAHAGGIRRPQGWAAEKQRMGGGVLIDIGVHYIRGLRLLLGEPDTVMASRAMQINTKMSEEDSVQLLFSSGVGWEAHMLLSWATHRGHLPDIVVAGEKGTLHLWPRAKYIDYYPVAPLLRTQLVSRLRPFWLQEKMMRPSLQRVRIRLPERDVSGYLGEMQEFLAAVAEERQPVTPPEDGRRDLEIVMRCYDSLRTTNRSEIPPLGERH